MFEKLLNEKQVAEMLSCSLSKLRADRWLNRGVPYTKIGRGVRYQEADVLRFVEAHRVETSERE